MSKAHRTHEKPPRIEPLGLHNEFFYNFNIKESPVPDEDGNPTQVSQYHYDQVKCRFSQDGEEPVNVEELKKCLIREGYFEHKVVLE